MRGNLEQAGDITMTKCQIVSILSIVVSLFVLPGPTVAQDMVLPDAPSATLAVIPSSPVEPVYVRPTHETMFKNYAFNAFGPAPVVGAALAAGIGQWGNSPPEWHQGAEGYAKRFGSDFGMAATTTTTRYALSEVLRQDDLYYRCECSGVFPRLRHAVFSAVTARQGRNGHRVFSVSALLSPYAGSTVGVYGWYPDRFGAKDALRIGNYNLLAFIGGNVAYEFLYSGPHSLLSRVHLNNRHGAPEPGPNH